MAGINPYPACDFFEIEVGRQEDLARLENVADDLDLVVLAADTITPLSEEFLWVNRWCVDRGVSWIGGGLEDSYRATVGPTVVPFDTACYDCYQRRFRANVPDEDEFVAYEEYLKQKGKEAKTQVGGICSFSDIVGNILALEAAKYLAKFTFPATVNGIISIDLVSLSFQRHQVLKLPRCPTCGRTRDRPLRQVWLE